MTSCVNCAAPLSVGAKFCKKCGTPVSVQADVSPCVACNADVSVGAKFCKKCGTQVVVVDPLEIAAGTLVVVAEETVPAIASTVPFLPLKELSKKLEKTDVADSIPENTVVQPGLIFEPAPEPIRTPESESKSAPSSKPEIAYGAQATPIQDVALPPVSLPFNESPAFEIPVVSTSVESTFGLPEESGQSGQKRLKMIVAGLVVVAVVAGGLLGWHGWKKAASVEVVPATLPAPIVDSASMAEQAVPASPTLPDPGKPRVAVPPATSHVAAPSGADAPPVISSSAATAVPEAAMAPMRPQPAPAQTSSKISKPAQSADPMAGTLATLLGKADNYIANGQYDKAVATGESVLAIDPGNRAARAVISRARARQIDVLKSNSSLE